MYLALNCPTMPAILMYGRSGTRSELLRRLKAYSSEGSIEDI